MDKSLVDSPRRLSLFSMHPTHHIYVDILFLSFDLLSHLLLSIGASISNGAFPSEMLGHRKSHQTLSSSYLRGLVFSFPEGCTEQSETLKIMKTVHFRPLFLSVVTVLSSLASAAVPPENLSVLRAVQQPAGSPG